MADPLAPIFAAVREACSPRAWSRGVELTRAGAVVAEPSDDPEELRFRIVGQSGMISRQVVLWPDDAEWDCPCDTPDDACEHVAAAVIASRRSEEGGKGVQTLEQAGHVEYRFGREGDRLTLGRYIVTGEDEHRLNATLAALAAGRVEGPRFAASQADLAAELALGTHRHGVLPRPILVKLFRALSRVKSARLDGEAVTTGVRVLRPVVRIEDADDGAFHVALADPLPIDERFANGVVRSGDVLHVWETVALNPRERELLTRGRTVQPGEVGELMTGLLADLRGRIELDVRTERLPDSERVPPRIEFQTEVDDEGVDVLATIVYGDPPRARLDGDKLVHLGGSVPLRDERSERRLASELKRGLGVNAGVRERFEGAEAVAFRRRFEEASVQPPAAMEAFRLAPPLDPSLAVGEDGFEAGFVSRGADGREHGSADPARVLRAWSEGEPLVPLLGGGWAPIPADWLARFGHRLLDLLAARDDGELPAASKLDLLALAEDLQTPMPPEFERLRASLEDFTGLPEPTLPDDLRAELRPYQREGVAWLQFLRSAGLCGLLADDMGLGKTLQAICVLEGRTLVVAPTSVLVNWQRELERFRPGLTTCLYHGANRELDPDADVTLTSYALLRLDRDRLTAQDWRMVVLDEAQAIKNPDSQVSRAAFALAADWKLTLTGTPVENRLDELWSQLHFLSPGYLGDRDGFRERYDPGDPEAMERLRARIRPLVLRRLKSEVAKDLPPRTDLVLRCELDSTEREVYDTVRATTVAAVVERLQAGGGVMQALEALLRLRQAACHPALIPGQQADGSSKLALLVETLDEVLAEGHKALVFSQWTSLLDLTEPALRASGVGFVRLDGTTRDRQAVVDRFQSDDGEPVMLVSLRAGGTGINLTAADHVFLLDLWWNPAVEDQAADRAHRIGQTRPVMVHRLVAADTVEERILALQESKRELARAALGEGTAGDGLSREDLLELLA